MSGIHIALLFPGQASQYVGMGKSLADNFPEAAEIFSRAADAVEFDITSLCFEGPADQLKLTEFQQPCVLTVSIAAFACLKTRLGEGVFVSAAGHSLGEYSALVAANALKFEDAVKLVHARGQLMQQAVPAGQGAMAALMGKGQIEVEALCREVSKPDDACYPANFNSPGQIVISGHTGAVTRAVGRAKEFGARISKMLDVSAPFHSPLMLPAAKAFEEKLQSISLNSPSFNVYSNVTGDLHASSADKIKNSLVDQITSPVLFSEIGRSIAQAEGEEMIIECGPGKVLTGLMKRISPKTKVVNLGEKQDFDAILELIDSIPS